MAVQKIFSQQIDSGGISNGKVLTANSASNTAYWATPAASGATWAALIATNTAIRALDAQKLQVANAVTTYQTKAIERAALANTNSRINLLNTNLTGTNTAIRALDTAKLSVANAVSTYATKSSPTTSGLLAHTGRATISTNLAVSGNTTLSGTIVANGSVGTAGHYLRTSGTGIYWSPVAAGGGSAANGFSGILVGANVVSADSTTDRLTLVAGSGITIAANPATDTITFASTGGVTGGTAGQVLVSAGSGASSYWASVIPLSAYSWLFNGSNQYLTVPSNAAFAFGTGDFTVECWIWYNPIIGNTYGKMILDGRPAATNGQYINLGLDNTGKIGIALGSNYYVSSSVVTNRTWVHIAASRQSGTVRLFVNGVIVASGTGNTNNLLSGGYFIGQNAFMPADTYFNGYISNLRVVKGVAAYTGAFTPPTSPLGTAQGSGTNIAAVSASQTSLLTCNNLGAPGITDSSSNAFTITNVNGASVSQFAPFSSFSAISRSATQTQTILTSGSGTYYTPYGVAWLRVRMVGGGGGGGGGSGGGNGSAGSSTTFGTSLLTAGGGSGGTFSAIGGAGGTATIGSGATGIALTGGGGSTGIYCPYPPGGWGGVSPFGGAGIGGLINSGAAVAGGAAVTNSGSGGGGGNSTGNLGSSGGAGGAGGYVEAYISSPAASYAYAIGTGGGGGTGTASSGTGGGGGSGIIIVEENYAVSASSANYTVSYLMVAGGGAGGNNNGGGGGAGGLLTGTVTLVVGSPYTIVVGAGGAGGLSGTINGNNGTNTTFYALTAVGGGGGAGYQLGAGASGGSGGGGFAGWTSVAGSAGGSGTSGQGNAGAAGSGVGQSGSTSGGGGGAGAVGGVSVRSNGGAGLASSITGTTTYYAGGGGGSAYPPGGGTVGAGGVGGGGAGASGGAAGSGTVNTGGGGGGTGGDTVGTNGAGGSGVVILAIPVSNYSGLTSGSPTVTTNGPYKILTFTQSGSYTA